MTSLADVDALTDALGVAGVAVRRGPVPPCLPDAAASGPVHDVAPGRSLLRLPGVGRFLAVGGRRVTVAADPGATDADLACFLAGPVRHACWLQQGRFGLRGAAVDVGGRVVAITGPSTAGASSVAAVLAADGHGVLADDGLPVGVGDDGGAEAAAVEPRLRLWPDAAERIGLDPAAGDLVRPGLARRAHVFRPAPDGRLAAVVVLERSADVGAPTAAPVTGARRADALGRATLARPLVVPSGLAAPHFAWLVRLAASVTVVRIRSDRHLDDAVAVAALVATTVRS